MPPGYPTFSAMKMVSVEIGRAANPAQKNDQHKWKWSYTMGDKRGKKDKRKVQKQKVTKKEQQAQKKQDKQPKSTP